MFWYFNLKSDHVTFEFERKFTRQYGKFNRKIKVKFTMLLTEIQSY